MKVDFLIVGLGIAGMTFIEHLRRFDRSFVVYENESQNSSLVAGGLYNPVVLKRFTPVWNTKEQLDYALPFYKDLEQAFGKQYDFPIDILRIFKSVEEQNNWFACADHPTLSEFMVPEVFPNTIPQLKAPLGFGKIQKAGKVEIGVLIADYRNKLTAEGTLLKKEFHYDELIEKDNRIFYEDYEVKHLIFCEGYGLQVNPYFNFLPLQGLKGEVLDIYAPELKLESMIKSSVFLLPLGDDKYKVGATFNKDIKDSEPTAEGREELINNLNEFLDTPYEVTGHYAGMRPTVKDRRPLLGEHPIHKNFYIFNGMGTRGVMLAPLMAQKLYQYIENGVSLPGETDIKRFRKYSRLAYSAQKY